jgi:hypothetical protein
MSQMQFQKQIRASFSRFLGKTQFNKIENLRSLCIQILDDIPTPACTTVLARLNKMRRPDDVWYLRPELFGVISQYHGECIARSRINSLDEKFIV